GEVAGAAVVGAAGEGGRHQVAAGRRRGRGAQVGSAAVGVVPEVVQRQPHALQGGARGAIHALGHARHGGRGREGSAAVGAPRVRHGDGRRGPGDGERGGGAGGGVVGAAGEGGRHQVAAGGAGGRGPEVG